jgi:hypothetical protein
MSGNAITRVSIRALKQAVDLATLFLVLFPRHDFAATSGFQIDPYGSSLVLGIQVNVRISILIGTRSLAIFNCPRSSNRSAGPTKHRYHMRRAHSRRHEGEQ